MRVSGLCALTLPVTASTVPFLASTLFIDLTLVATHPLREFPEHTLIPSLLSGVLLPPLCLCVAFPHAPAARLPTPPPPAIETNLVSFPEPAPLIASTSAPMPAAAIGTGSAAEAIHRARKGGIAKGMGGHSHARTATARRVSGQQRGHLSFLSGSTTPTNVSSTPSTPRRANSNASNAIAGRSPPSPARNARAPSSEPGTPTSMPSSPASIAHSRAPTTASGPTISPLTQLGVSWAAQMSFSYISAFTKYLTDSASNARKASERRAASTAARRSNAAEPAPPSPAIAPALPHTCLLYTSPSPRDQA
eukprot:TRINITY_DN18895_c0_g1_i3.p1 TRINITY_DN18895_c0_g1~~TRINITY_DN18895_c0_g1_i3.p1  ORF type:complete len:307 (-),score=-14.45 TRINITY_DN18895_c0_g1_i3:105-1025(-)